MTHTSFAAWRARMGFNKIQAARALGISRNAVAWYESGKHPVPRAIALACAALAFGLPAME